MKTARHGTIIRVLSTVVTVAIALSGCAGVVDLVGWGISFGYIIDARLPFGSLLLAGVALLMIMAVPMTAAAAGR